MLRRVLCFAAVVVILGCSSEDSTSSPIFVEADGAIDDIDRAIDSETAPDSTVEQDGGFTTDVDAATSVMDQMLASDSALSEDADVECPEVCIAAGITWGKVGGLTPYTEVYSLEPCRRQSISVTTPFATSPDEHSCERTLDNCRQDQMEVLQALNTRLTANEVRTIFSRGTLFGVDSRPYDGQVFSIQVDNQEILIGDPCDPGNSQCQNPPQVMQELADLLWDLGREMEGREPSCANLREGL